MIDAPLRRPLRWDEVPLPYGYPRSILDPGSKERLAKQHRDRVQDILGERSYILKKAANDRAYQAKVLTLCEKDPAWWIDHFCATYDDRVGTVEPLVLYPFQREKFVEPYLSMRSTTGRTRWTRVGNKSRGVGATWVALALRAHSFLFLEAWSVMVGGVTLRDVDDGGQASTHQSLLGKIRFLLAHLPPWMFDALLGPLFNREEWNKGGLLQNPLKPRNLIAGKQLGAMFGRGHRYSEALGDEIAWAEEMAAADTSIKQTTNRFEGFSTPQGKHTFHYQLFSGALPGVQTYTVHWSEHPELDLDWYNDQRQHMTDEQVAQELDCSFEASAGGRVLSEVHLDTHFTLVEPDLADEEALQKRGLPLLGAYDPGLPVTAIIDPGIADPMACVWGQWDEQRGQGRVLDAVQTKDRTIDWLVPFLLGRIPEATHRGQPWPHADYTPTEHRIIRRHALWGKPAIVLGDHYGTSRDLVLGLSAYEELAQYGIDVYPVKIDDDLQAISRLVLLMRYIRFAARLVDQRNGPPAVCPSMGEVVTQWRWPRRKEGDHRLVTKPIHDRFCHLGDCLKMWARMLDIPDAQQQPVETGQAKKARGADSVGGPKRWPRYLRRRRG